MEKIILNEYTEIQNIYEKLNVFQKSVLSAISYYGGYDIFEIGYGLIDTLKNGNNFSGLDLDDLYEINNITGAINFFDEYTTNDYDNWYESFYVGNSWDGEQAHKDCVDGVRDMLVKALTTGTDIDDLIEKDFQPKWDELTKTE